MALFSYDNKRYIECQLWQVENPWICQVGYFSLEYDEIGTFFDQNSLSKCNFDVRQAWGKHWGRAVFFAHFGLIFVQFGLNLSWKQYFELYSLPFFPRILIFVKKKGFGKWKFDFPIWPKFDPNLAKFGLCEPRFGQIQWFSH